MSQPSHRILDQLARRCREIGLPDKPEGVPDWSLAAVARGDNLMIVVFGPELCECCAKPRVKVVMCPKTERPLEELFR